MRLTDRAIARLRSRTREYTVWDSLVAGLGVRVRPTGGRSYVLLEDAGGRTLRVSLGPVSLKSVAEARRECHARKAEPEAARAPRRVVLTTAKKRAYSLEFRRGALFSADGCAPPP